MDNPLVSIGVDLSEAVVDSILEDGLLKEVPVIGTMVNVARSIRGVRERILLNKIRAFLTVGSSLNEDERRSFAEQMESDRAAASRIHAQLVIYLDRYDSLSKAEILGVLFAALARGEIPPDVFHRLAYRLDNCFADDLSRLEEFCKDPEGQVCTPPYPVLPGLVDPVENMSGEDGRYHDSNATEEDDNYKPDRNKVLDQRGRITILVSNDGKRYTVRTQKGEHNEWTVSAVDSDN